MNRVAWVHIIIEVSMDQEQPTSETAHQPLVGHRLVVVVVSLEERIATEEELR